MSSDVKYHLIGTYHKSGTVWMQRVFERIANQFSIPFVKKFDESRREAVLGSARACAFHDHCLFPNDVVWRSDVRILHIVRDPRDMILSAMHYHQRVPKDREQWAHKPRPNLHGLSYQEYLLSLETEYDKLMFEMANSHRANMNLMWNWDYSNPNSIERKYEDLMADLEGHLFGQTLRAMGFSAEEVSVGVGIFVESHIRNRTSREHSTEVVAGHARENVVTNWRREMPRKFAEAYVKVYGDHLIKLGYETDHAWVSQL